MSTEEEKEQDRINTIGRRYNDPDSSSSRAKFSEIRGLCRTCTHAFIRRREMSEVPSVICLGTYETPHRVPLDIMECSEYQRVGEMHIRDMHDLAFIIDARKKGGQYL